MNDNQNMLMMIGAVVLAFIMAGGMALCRPRPDVSSYEDNPDYQEMQAEMEEMRRAREARLNPEPAPAPRIAGAYYPDENAAESSGGSVDPLVLAVVGGGLVFGLVGAGAFIMMGGLGSKEEKVAASDDEDDLLSDEPRSDA